MSRSFVVVTLSLLEILTFLRYLVGMNATLSIKGQITIPLKIREKLHLKTGDVLDFDENASFLKAVRVISPEAWENFGAGWRDPWPGRKVQDIMDELRGPVELPRFRK